MMEQEPIGIGQALGIKLGMLVAGFGGGVVSVYFSQGLTRAQSAFSVICSLITATYLTPAFVHYAGIEQPEYQYGLAFVVGLCTMGIIPAIKAAGSRITTNALNKAIDQPTQGEGDAK